MPNSNNIHVVPHGNQWAAQREGAERASTICPTQHEAFECILQMKYSFIISKDGFENVIPMGKTLIPLKDKVY